jgi:hypothetical protein
MYVHLLGLYRDAQCSPPKLTRSKQILTDIRVPIAGSLLHAQRDALKQVVTIGRARTSVGQPS